MCVGFIFSAIVPSTIDVLVTPQKGPFINFISAVAKHLILVVAGGEKKDPVERFTNRYSKRAWILHAFSASDL